jgi:hypothetical protein
VLGLHGGRLTVGLGAREVGDPDGALVGLQEAFTDEQADRRLDQLQLVFLGVEAPQERLHGLVDVSDEGAVVFGQGVQELAQAAGHDGPGSVLQGFPNVLFAPAFFGPVAAAHGCLPLR